MAGDSACPQILILAQLQENEQLCGQLTALPIELASLRERIGPSSRKSSKPRCSNGPGFQPPDQRMGSGRKRGGQPGLLPIERVDEVVDDHPDTCRRCDTLLQGEGPDPLRHQLREFPPITPLVIAHRLHQPKSVKPVQARATPKTNVGRSGWQEFQGQEPLAAGQGERSLLALQPPDAGAAATPG